MLGTRPDAVLGRPGQVLVHTRHAERVQEDLTRNGPGCSVAEDASADLGLVRLEVPGEEELLGVLAGVRERCAKAFDGWVPAIGGNPLLGIHLDPLTGAPVLHGLGGGPPRPDAPLPGRSATGPGRGQVIGVLDTGVSAHPWFDGAFLASPDDVEHLLQDWDVNRDGVIDAQAGHATFITGLVLQRAPSATVRVRRVLTTEGVADSLGVARALVAAAADGATILNVSLGGYTPDDTCPLALSAALEQLPPDVLVVAAAGNQSSRRPYWPAAAPGVLAVGGVERGVSAWQPAAFTNSGAWVDCAAPSRDVVSTFLTVDGPLLGDPGGTDPDEFRGWARWSGTSFAAAAVSGMVAARAATDGVPAREAASRLLADGTDLLPELGPVLGG